MAIGSHESLRQERGIICLYRCQLGEDEGGLAVEAGSLKAKTGVEVEVDGERFLLTDGDVVIAAITSCTNTSNPELTSWCRAGGAEGS